MGIDLRAYHEPPKLSEDGRYEKINICPECHLHTEHEISLFVPCWRCGYVGGSERVVAKWDRFSPRWKFWRRDGYWRTKNVPYFEDGPYLEATKATTGVDVCTEPKARQKVGVNPVCVYCGEPIRMDVVIVAKTGRSHWETFDKPISGYLAMWERIEEVAAGEGWQPDKVEKFSCYCAGCGLSYHYESFIGRTNE